MNDLLEAKHRSEVCPSLFGHQVWRVVKMCCCRGVCLLFQSVLQVQLLGEQLLAHYLHQRLVECVCFLKLGLQFYIVFKYNTFQDLFYDMLVIQKIQAVPFTFNLLFYFKANHLLFFVWCLMNGKQKDVSIHNQPIKEKLSEEGEKNIGVQELNRRVLSK